jgi:glycosyltransferase involved in cell wall biosynthesis
LELRRIGADHELRARLAAKGREVAKRLTWERAAAALAEVFHGVLSKR